MIKGAIIGLGKIARTAHMQAYMNDVIKGNISIVAGVDISETNRNLFKKSFPEAMVHSTIEDVFSETNIDFIDVCVPPWLHGNFIKYAIKKDINVLCEKPFTAKLSEANTLRNKLLASNIVFHPVHQYKYSPVWRQFKKTIENSKSANKILLQFNVYRTSADSGYDEKYPSWRTIGELSGGGILSDTGSHYLYLVNWLLGEPLTVASVNLNLRKSSYNVEDTTITIINTEKGVGEINLTWAADKRMNTAFFTDGTNSLYYDGSKLELTEDGKLTILEVPDASDKKSYIKFYEELMLDFISEIRSGKQNVSLINESYNVMKMLYCCYKSDKAKKTLAF